MREFEETDRPEARKLNVRYVRVSMAGADYRIKAVLDARLRPRSCGGGSAGWTRRTARGDRESSRKLSDQARDVNKMRGSQRRNLGRWPFQHRTHLAELQERGVSSRRRGVESTLKTSWRGVESRGEAV